MRRMMAALAICAGLLAGCAGARDAGVGEELDLKAPLSAAAAALDDVVRKVEAGNAAAGREAYQAFANAFGQVLGPVSMKDTAVAQRIANANTGLQEALEQGAVDRAAVRREADLLSKGLRAAANVVGVPLSATASARLGAAMQPARVVEVTAREYRFEPRVINVQPGERVTVRLRNAGKEKHEWEAEGLHAEIRPIAPGTTGEVTFTAPMKTGTYEFACHVDDHDKKGMIGFVVVR